MRNLRAIFFLVFISTPAFTQFDPALLRFQKITKDQGLPYNYVHSVTQDQTGFIWLGTHYGLVRYDGYDFKIFQPDPDKPYSITHKSINLVYPDSKGNLWLSINSGGINRMNLQNEQFKGFFPDSTINSIGNETRFFYEDSDKNLWMGTNNGLFLFDWQKDSFVYALSGKKFVTPTNAITDLADDKYGHLWFIIDNKIGILNKKSGIIQTFSELIKEPAFINMAYTSVYCGEKGKVWLTTNKGLFCYIIAQNSVERFLEEIPGLVKVFVDRNRNLYVLASYPVFKWYAFKHEDIEKKRYSTYQPFEQKKSTFGLKIIEDRSGNIWITKHDGLAFFNFKSGCYMYKSNPLNPHAISDDSNIDYVFLDRNDNLWICPERQGINKADLRQKPFKLIAPEAKTLDDIWKYKIVSAVSEDIYGNLWMGNSEKGITIYETKTGKFYKFKLENENTIISIYKDHEGYMWLGAYGDSVCRVKPPKLTNHSTSNEQFFNDVTCYNIINARKIVADKLNNIWVASEYGLLELDRLNNKITNYSEQYDKHNERSSFYRTVFVDMNQNVWTGSDNGGLCLFDRQKKTFVHYLHNNENNRSISSNTVYAIYQENEKCFWIATSEGIDKFDPATSLFEKVDIGKELRKRSVFSILPDTSGNLWMSSDNGIIRYSRRTQETSFYNRPDGLQNTDFVTTASYSAASGEIYFGCSDGVTSFNPYFIISNPTHAKPVFTNLYIYNKPVSVGDTVNKRVLLNKQLWDTKEISIYHYESDFTIEFSSLHFSAPEKNRYQYKLEGFNKDWSDTDAKRRFASYTGLPPGEYTFMLRATNNDGLMCAPGDEARLKIIIIPPIYQTVWFRILFLLFLVASIIAFIRYRLKTLREKNVKLNKMVRARTIELEEANAFLEQKTRALEEVNTLLEERQEEISLQNEEITTQYESLENTNQLLQEQQNKIIEQNIELDQHKNKLESLVEERTRELEEALVKAEESDKLKTSFLQNMSHEIRTPMNSILGFSSLLKDEDYSEKRDEFIDMIRESGKTLLTLIDDILELSIMQTHQVSLKPSVIKLNQTLRRIYETFKIETNKKKSLTLNINVSLIDEDFLILLDEIRLKQVFSNLLSNAIKYTQNGIIEFGVSEISDQITFYVKDTGIGIPENIGDAIFERFYKVESNLNQLYRGTGLGLAICKNLVSLWNGNIWYNSLPEKGTTFFFSHPRSEENANLHVPASSSFDKEVRLRGKLILIAEDEESNYILLENYIRKTKAEILWAKNGSEAVEMANNNKVDLVIMDIKMPLMDGLKASKIIRERFPKIPIIAQTAFTFKQEIDKILKLGINAYLTKPINKQELLKMISDYI